jgi:hypothetical protein
MSMDSHVGMILTGETEKLGKKIAAVLFCPPKITR